MLRHDFAYDLPPELIAQTPLAERSASRLLVLDGAEGSPAPRDCTMRDFAWLLRPGDLLVFNDTKVVAARLLGTKPSGGRVEIFLERVVGANEAVVQLRASKPIRDGLEVTTAGGVVRVLGRQDDLWRVEFPGSALEFFEQWGDVPLPPYIHRTADANDRERYQSIFARERGAVAAPTASLHFDSQLIREIEARGVSRAFVTLHVGAGTFQPVRTDDLESHVMHAERVSVSAATCEAINKTRAGGGRVVAIGTTVVRALESAALAARGQIAASATGVQTAAPATGVQIGASATGVQTAAPATGVQIGASATGVQTPASATGGQPAASATGVQTAAPATGAVSAGPLPAAGWSGDTRLFIRPGFDFRVADALLTNFHLPESTLLMLVCAFAGKDAVLGAYEHAVRARYRFFSYGDAMFLTNARVRG
ncbi:MAG: tRNA preQ1(34) S-adenosylmethionine ribosyltransferase-isomerase QueA [Steroidobacteraceae bacterium]